MQTANNRERKFLYDLKSCSKSLIYKIDKPWVAEQKSRMSRLSTLDPIKVRKMSALVKIVSKYYNIPVSEIRGHSRKRHLVTARYVFCEIAHNHLFTPFIPIGMFLGGRDHSSIVHAVNPAFPCIEFNDSGVTDQVKEIRELYDDLNIC